MDPQRCFAVCVVAILFAPATTGQERALESRLRTLEKEIAAVRGLAFQSPVNAKVIARPKEADKGIQGFYSIKDKTLYLYNDISGAYEKGVLIHEMVHALQDQHFDLGKLKARLHLTSADDADAERALAALIEGDATFTMIEVLKAAQPNVAKMLDVPLEKAKNLDNAFLYAQGARYVKAMKERGGWENVNAAYRFPPRNTASVLNMSIVAAIDLGPGKTSGAFATFKLLSSHEATRAQAVQLASAWRGDRQLEPERGGGQAGIFAFASAAEATSFHSALATLRAAQMPAFAPTDPKLEEPGVISARLADGAVWEVVLRGQRVLAITAPNEQARRRSRDRLEGPPDVTVFEGKAKKQVSFGAMVDALLAADLICIGETHNAELHHRVQLQIIKTLFAQDERLAVGMEMFQRPFQAALDTYITGGASEAEFLKAAEYGKRWGYSWSLYKPIVDFCRNNRVPVAALNAPKELTSRISKVGHAALTPEEKEKLGPMDFDHKEHRAYWYERLPKLHGQADTTPEQKERSYQVMTVWDDYMAASAASFQRDRHIRRMVILAGSGHIDRGFGIPDRAARRTGGKAVTIKISAASEAAGDDEPVTDFTILVR
jgi:uncharacterized iron-regulated protein